MPRVSAKGRADLSICLPELWKDEQHDAYGRNPAAASAGGDAEGKGGDELMDGFRNMIERQAKWIVVVTDDRELLDAIKIGLVAEAMDDDAVLAEAVNPGGQVYGEGKWYFVDGHRRIRYDRGNQDIGVDDNLHLYAGNNQIGTFTAGGRSHDNWTGQIPKKFADFIQEYLPHVTIPPNRQIEELEHLLRGEHTCLLVEVR